MAYDQLLSAYKVQVNQLVGSKVAEDSIDPTDVAAIGIQLADLLIPILNTINDFAITGGTIPPDNENGIDFDLYIQGGTSLVFWRKRNGIWVQEAAVDLGIQIVDGNITLQASVNEFVVTVSAGSWGINNIIYSKAVQTQLNLTAADLNFNRIDTIVADTTGTIYILNGVASANPNPAALPANSIVVAFVYVPASSSGDLPYISDSNASPSTIIDDAIVSLVKTWSSSKINRMSQPWDSSPTPLYGVRWIPIDGTTYEFFSLSDNNITQPSLTGSGTGEAAWEDTGEFGFPAQYIGSTTYPSGRIVWEYDPDFPGDPTKLVTFRSLQAGNIGNPLDFDGDTAWWEKLGAYKSPFVYVSGTTYGFKEVVIDDTDGNRIYISNIADNDFALDYVIPGSQLWQVIGPVVEANNPLTFTQADLVEVYEGNYSLSFELPDGKSIASVETKAGTITRRLGVSQAVTDTANSPNTIIDGFDNNSAQTITIKLI